jgi:hypothetical protein
MNKQTKMLLGLVVVAGAGYYIWQKNKPAKVNLASREYQKGACLCHTSYSKGMYNCGDGTHYSSSSNGYCKGRPNQPK